MSKKMNEAAVINELRGGSLFFPAGKAAPRPQPPEPVESPDLAAPQVPQPSPTTTSAPRTDANPTPTTHSPSEAVFDLSELPHRKASFLFTDQEFEALDDLKLALRRELDAKVTKEDLARCAVTYLVKEFRRNGASSAIFQPLRKRRTR